MCFKKKYNIPEDAPISEQARPYLEYKKRLNELDFRRGKEIDIALYCLNVNPTMMKDLNVNVERELSVLKMWIKRDYSNYLLCVKNNVEHIELLTLYIYEKLQKTLYANNNDISFIKSYDKKLVINYQYETKRGETISYFDNALGVPTSLVVAANVRLKLINAQKLVEKIDVDIKYIDASIVTNFITSVLNRTVRDTVLSFIAVKNLSFYDLPQYYTALNQDILDKLNAYFGECGLEATNFSVSDISVPNNTDELLKNQFFAIAEAERIKAHEQKLEKASLDLYERKAAIHSRYPDFPITLTEAEKDFALDRYLKRTGRDTSLKADIREEKLSKRTMVNDGTVTNERKVSLPTFIKKSNKFRIAYAIVVPIAYILALTMFALGLQAGFISLACVTLAAGFTAFGCYNSLKYGDKTKQIIDADYARNTDTYVSQQTEAAISAENNQNDSDDSDGLDDLV